MSAEPRVLAIMGSGETAPAMAKVHRALFDRFGRQVPAAILDTPYGFQENADDLSARTMEFFATSVGNPVEVASFRSADVDAVTAATALARIRDARYLMAGPGSPSYALRQWAGGPIPDALAEKLATGGILTMASAAALTLGVVSIPVYEVYKVGEPPRWLEGLDILGRATGLRAAVVPHYDNSEGGNHDTRFCYMGERRLRILEGLLAEDVFVLGVDSHTALLLDLEAGSASVAGLGGVTVRVRGQSARFETGASIGIEALGDAARGLAAGQSAEAVHGAALAGAMSTEHAARTEPMREEMQKLEGTFMAALQAGEVRDAVGALLALDDSINARVRAGEDSPDLDNAAATFQALVVRLGDAAGRPRDRRSDVAPLVEVLLELRETARAAKDWPAADLIRDRLAAAGVEVRDGASGFAWELAEG